MNIAIQRDGNGKFEPKLVKEYQTNLAGDIEDKIIPMNDLLHKALFFV